MAARVALVLALKRRGIAIDRAEDLAQTASVNALEARARFDSGRPMLPWLLTIALRVEADERRRRERRPPEGALPDGLAAAAGEERIFREESERVAGAMGVLSRVERTVVDLFYREGLSVAAIGERLSLAAGTVKSHLHRARASLAAALLRRRRP